MSVPRRETGFLGNTKVCPVVVATREALLWAHVVPVRVNLPAFVYVAFEQTLLNFAPTVLNCTIALYASETVEAGSVSEYAFPLLYHDCLFFGILI